MKEYIKINICAGSLCLALLASCSQEVVGPTAADEGEGNVLFRTSLPSVVSRGEALEEVSALTSFQVAAFLPEEDGVMSFGFTEFVRNDGESLYRSAEGDRPWPANKGEKNGMLEFFAYYPAMQTASLSDVTDEDGALSRRRLSGFEIGADISGHIDFLTAHTIGSKTMHLHSGVELGFEHQLCRISDIKVWGANKTCNIEIAGIRIGASGVKGDFIFNVGTSEETGPQSVGSWADIEKGSVEYIFKNGDPIVVINNEEGICNAKTDAISLLGNAGSAMVIPSANSLWIPSVDSLNENKGMYFSVLMRVTDSKTGLQLYPYADDDENETMVSLHVGEDGVIGGGEEMKDFAWAAIPVAVDWKPGMQYSYVLDYSNGVGLHDPEGAVPGTPIISDNVGITVTVNEWGEETVEDVIIPTE